MTETYWGDLPGGERVDPDNGFWESRAELRHIRDFARSRGANPYATLGAVMRRTIANIEPNVVLPSTIGGQVSLNLFTAPAGPSGAGKDIANAAGYDGLGFFQTIGNMDTPVDDPFHINPGSGEGVARLFAGTKKTTGVTAPIFKCPTWRHCKRWPGAKGRPWWAGFCTPIWVSP
jgi:hypothetical protein